MTCRTTSIACGGPGSRLESDLENPDSQLRGQMSSLLTGLAEELDSDEEMQAWVNAWLVESRWRWSMKTGMPLPA